MSTKNLLKSIDLQENKNYKVTLSVHTNNQWVDAVKHIDVTTPKFLESSLGAYTTSSVINKDYNRTDKYIDGVFTPGRLKTTTTTYKVKSFELTLIAGLNGGGRLGVRWFDPSLSKAIFKITFDKNLPQDLTDLTGFSGVLANIFNGTKLIKHDSINKNKVTLSLDQLFLMPEIAGKRPTKATTPLLSAGYTGFWDNDTYFNLWSLSKNPNTATNKPLWKNGELTTEKTSIVGASNISPSTQSTFTNTCSITSKLASDSIYDSLYWNEEVKDFIYYFIADDNSYAKQKWWYFSNTNSINPATIKNGDIVPITGNNGYITISKNNVTSAPPTKSSSDLSSRPQYATCTYFTGSESATYTVTSTGKETTNSPNFGIRTIYVKFAIARYIKQSDGSWKGTWLPSGYSARNVLSTTEALSGK